MVHGSLVLTQEKIKIYCRARGMVQLLTTTNLKVKVSDDAENETPHFHAHDIVATPNLQARIMVPSKDELRC